MYANYPPRDDFISALAALHDMKETFESLSALNKNSKFAEGWTGAIQLADGTQRSVMNLAEGLDKISGTYQKTLFHLGECAKHLKQYPGEFSKLQDEILDTQFTFEHQLNHLKEVGDDIGNPDLIEGFITDISSLTKMALTVMSSKIPTVTTEELSEEEPSSSPPTRTPPTIPPAYMPPPPPPQDMPPSLQIRPTRVIPMPPFPAETAAKAYAAINAFAIEEHHTAETLGNIATTIQNLLIKNEANKMNGSAVFPDHEVEILLNAGEAFHRAASLSSELSAQCNQCLKDEGKFDIGQFCKTFQLGGVSLYESYTKAIKEVITLVKPLATITNNNAYKIFIVNAMGGPAPGNTAQLLQQSAYQVTQRLGAQKLSLEIILQADPDNPLIISALETIKVAMKEVNEALAP